MVAVAYAQHKFLFFFPISIWASRLMFHLVSGWQRGRQNAPVTCAYVYTAKLGDKLRTLASFLDYLAPSLFWDRDPDAELQPAILLSPCLLLERFVGLSGVTLHLLSQPGNFQSIHLAKGFLVGCGQVQPTWPLGISEDFGWIIVSHELSWPVR
jgi:hypothetical protein